jgi:hypothetical protein
MTGDDAFACDVSPRLKQLGHVDVIVSDGAMTTVLKPVDETFDAVDHTGESCKFLFRVLCPLGLAT